jgi:hypothetical protein
MDLAAPATKLIMKMPLAKRTDAPNADAAEYAHSAIVDCRAVKNQANK